MRLEVIADNKGAVIYVLNRPEIYIGSVETNDIVIPAKEVSKKHLKLILTDDGKCFIIDQGSTNGTYLDDEKLIPGRREEFRMNSSIRLGSQVLLTLLGKDKGVVTELPLRQQFVEEKKIKIADEDKTRVISLKTLQKTKTEKVRKKRLKKLEKEISKKKQVRKDKKTINQAIMMSLVVFGIAWGAMKVWDLAKKRKPRQTIVGRLKETQMVVYDQIDSSLDESAPEMLIDSAELLPVEEIAKHVEDVNCALPEESFFCKRMPKGSRKKNGALLLNNQMVLYLEKTEWVAKAQALASSYASLTADGAASPEVRSDGEEDTGGPAAPEETPEEVSLEMLHRIGFLSYIKQYLWIAMPPEYQDYNLYFAFYDPDDLSIVRVLAIRSRLLPKLNARYTEDFFKSRRYNPYKIISRLDRFYKLYQ